MSDNLKTQITKLLWRFVRKLCCVDLSQCIGPTIELLSGYFEFTNFFRTLKEIHHTQMFLSPREGRFILGGNMHFVPQGSTYYKKTWYFLYIYLRSHLVYVVFSLKHFGLVDNDLSNSEYKVMLIGPCNEIIKYVAWSNCTLVCIRLVLYCRY